MSQDITKMTPSHENIEIIDGNDFSQFLIYSFDKCVIIDDDREIMYG